VQQLVHRSPRAFDLPQTRWTLAGLRTVVGWLWPLSLTGVYRVLKRLGIVWKRARDYVHSPDPHYAAKQTIVTELCQQSQAPASSHVLVYLDEVTLGRQPTVTNAYVERGHAQVHAQRSHQADTLTRVVASLDHAGRVVFRRATKITLSTLVQFYQDLRAAYPTATRIYVVQDNWPVHTHPDVLVALEAQTTPFAWHRPRSWPTEASMAAVKRWGHLQLPIQIVPLPTYASWLNPIEKLWRKLRQEVTHLHPWADDLARLRHEVDQFLAQFAHGSSALLQYVGLGVPV